MGDAKVKFVMKPLGDVLWPLALHIARDGGKTEVQTVTARLHPLSAEELQKLTDDNAEKGALEFEKAFYDKVVKGFVDVADQDGDPVPDNVAIPFFRELRFARIAVMQAHGEIVSGRDAELAKN